MEQKVKGETAEPEQTIVALLVLVVYRILVYSLVVVAAAQAVM
jgi:hypothetical protein